MENKITENLTDYDRKPNLFGLIKKLEKINAVAAAKLRNRFDGCNDASSLKAAFTWYDTPEGHAYWHALHKQLAKEYRGYIQ